MTIKNYIFLFLLLISIDSHAQKIEILSFGESVHFGRPYSNCDFVFQYNKNTMTLNKDSMNTFIFYIPGDYIIAINPKRENEPKVLSNKENDEQDNIPKYIALHVDSVREEFEPTTIALSYPLIQNKSCEGTIMSLKAYYSNYYHTPIHIIHPNINTSGLGTEIVGILDSTQFILNPGVHILKFHLKGICTMPSYIQFNLTKNNGVEVPIGWTTPVSKQ